MCQIGKSSDIDYRELVLQLIEVAPCSHGWWDWEHCLQRAGELLEEGCVPPEVILAELVTVAPRPKNYHKWRVKLDEVSSMLNLVPCGYCHKLTETVELHYLKSEYDFRISGMMCPRCLELLHRREFLPPEELKARQEFHVRGLRFRTSRTTGYTSDMEIW